MLSILLCISFIPVPLGHVVCFTRYCCCCRPCGIAVVVVVETTQNLTNVFCHITKWKRKVTFTKLAPHNYDVRLLQ